MEWILCENQLPERDGLYAVSYDGTSWRPAIWDGGCFCETFSPDGNGAPELYMPKWWLDVKVPEPVG